jgi:hypothetical protein
MSIFYDTTTLLNKARQQQYSIQEEVKLLSESYEEVYEVDYEQLIDDLLDEGYSEEEVIEYLEEKMTDAEKRSLPARSRQKLGITGPSESKKGKKLVGGALKTSLEKTRNLRQQRRASAAPTERQQKIAQKSITNFIATAGRQETPIKTSAESPKKETKQRSSFKASTKGKSVSSGSLTRKANEVRLAAGREFQNKAAKSATIADLRKKYEKIAPGPSTVDRLQSAIAAAQKEKPRYERSREARAASGRGESREQRRERLGLNVGTRRSRRKARAERAAERRGASVDKSPRNRDLVMKGVKGGVEKYAKKVAGKIKKFFGKEDVNLIDATTYLLISEGYNDETIMTILEWIESEIEADETYLCLEIVENVVEGAMIYNFMVENFEFEYEDDVYDVIEQLSMDDIEYIIESVY